MKKKAASAQGKLKATRKASGTPTEKKNKGRYTPELGEKILTRFANGEPFSVAAINEGVPESTARYWREKYPEFAANNARARELFEEHWRDEFFVLMLEMIVASGEPNNTLKVTALNNALSALKWWLSHTSFSKADNALAASGITSPEQLERALNTIAERQNLFAARAAAEQNNETAEPLEYDD